MVGNSIVLNNGVKIPAIGFGTYRLFGQRAETAVAWALKAGYRHIDTAKAYSNEQRIGNVLKSSDIPREDLFITTKLWNTDHGYKPAIKAIDTSLHKLGLDYVDLYLIHWPIEGFTETWGAMVEILECGKARAIGVSNFQIHHLEKLVESTNVVPAMNQIECTPYLYDRALIAYCREHGTAITASSPLTRGTKLDDPRLARIADNYEKTPAQILIRWGLQHGIVEIPKSRHENRIKENIHVFDFEISKKDLDELDGFHENLRVHGSAVHKKLAEKYLKTSLQQKGDEQK